jgi:hypothetical protein
VSPARPNREVLAAVAEVMRSRQTRWYLFGAQAVLVWGRPRTTVDVDITAEVDLDDLRSFVTAMERAGFQLRVPASGNFEELVARTRVLPLVHVATSIPLDLVVAGPGLEEQFLERAVDVDLGGVSVPVISPEDLIAAKILANRGKDLEDVRGILQERSSSLDLERIRYTLSVIENALGRSDLTPVLDSEVARARS